MRIFYVAFLLFFVSGLAKGQAPLVDCRSFHTGEYLYTDSAGDTWELRRKAKLQIERNKRTGKIIKFKIRWLSDCEYRLTQTWTNVRNRRKWNRGHFSYRIIQTTPDSYSYDCLCKDSQAITGTVVRAMN